MRNRKYWLIFIVMAPIQAFAQILPALIGAGASLITGVFDAAAKAEERKKQMMMDAQKSQYEGAVKSAQSLGSGQQRSFESLMDGYKSVLTR